MAGAAIGCGPAQEYPGKLVWTTESHAAFVAQETETPPEMSMMTIPPTDNWDKEWEVAQGEDPNQCLLQGAPWPGKNGGWTGEGTWESRGCQRAEAPKRLRQHPGGGAK